MQTIQLQINASVGLHARPAALFVKKASQYGSRISVRNVSADSAWADAKSILSILTLGVEQGHTIEIRADGEDEGQALEGLSTLVQNDFADPANLA